jgi:hypothetical protein
MSEAPAEGRGADPISDYLAVMTGAAPVGTLDETDAARVRDGIQVLTDANAASKATRKLNRSAARVRIVRAVAWIVLVVAAVWIAANVFGYFTATQYERPVTMGGSTLAPATVQWPDGSREGADCFGANAGASVWKAAPPASLVAPYRCGHSIGAAIVPGPISAGAWALGFVSAIVLVELHRRRKIAWY